jgi:hypothetical protein
MKRIKEIMFTAFAFVVCIIAGIVLMICDAFDCDRDNDPYDYDPRF